MLEVSGGADGATFALRCRPSAPRTRLRGIHGGALKVDLAAEPEDGAANDELVRFVAGLLGVPRAAVALVRGASARGKTLRVSGITPAAVSARFSAALAAIGDGSGTKRGPQ